MAIKVSQQPFICLRCLSRNKRSYSTHTPLPAAPPTSGATKLTSRRLISLHGQEAPKFLQGIITNNIKPESRSSLFAAFLTAQGKVLHDVFVYPTTGSQWHTDNLKSEEHGYLVEVDEAQASKLFAHLKRHKLRAKIQLRLLEDGELNIWSTWKEEEKWTPHPSSLGENPEIGNVDSDGNLALVDTRATGMGHRILLPSDSSLSKFASYQGLEETGLDSYRIRRYLRGVPEGQVEIPRDGVFPMNTNIDVMNGIDFRKGCYVGQELTIRTHHTGVVRRRILPVALYEPDSTPPENLQYDPFTTTTRTPEQDADIKTKGKRGRPGKWISGVGNIGIAMCRLEMMSDLVVSGEPSTFSPDDRFIIKTGGEDDTREYGIKAFVPDWIRGKIRPPKVLKRVE